MLKRKNGIGVALVFCICALSLTLGLSLPSAGFNTSANALPPLVTMTPSISVTVNIDANFTLESFAMTQDGGTISYQWFSNTTNNHSTGTATAIPGQTNQNFTPSTATAGTFFFFVRFTNTSTGTPYSRDSVVTTFTVLARVDADIPVITTQPAAATSILVGQRVTLTTLATVGDGGNIRYRWLSSATPVNTGGTQVQNWATSPNFQTPANLAIGTHHFFAEVENFRAVNGTQRQHVRTNVATVTVTAPPEPEPARAPNISGIYRTVMGDVDRNTPVTFTVQANSTDGGVLSFQWFENSTASTSGGVAIAGATNAAFSPTTFASGTRHFYVVVTNTNLNAFPMAANWTSSVMTLTVNAPQVEEPGPPIFLIVALVVVGLMALGVVGALVWAGAQSKRRN